MAGSQTIDEASAPVRGVSDTARWVAYFRAKETNRPDALFRDPYAESLAGARGFHLAHTLPDGNKHEWAWVARTYRFDDLLTRQIQSGAQLVVNLAAGLCARPYRMQLPADLQWVEVDLPDIISYKEEILVDKTPKCRLERVALDLSETAKRDALFDDLNSRGKKTVVVTEGLLIYFAPEEVASLARDLAARSNFQNWIIDLASPGQLRLMQRTTGKQLQEAGAAFKFGPQEGAKFFAPFGWEAKESHGLLKTAAQFKRAPEELLTLLPEPKVMSPHYPWTGVCWLAKSS